MLRVNTATNQTKRLSDHAAVALAIRKHIKTVGIKGKVTSQSYAGGNSVRVAVDDLTPTTARVLEDFAGQYQYGHFDGMVDLYEYSNNRADIPQVKFVFVNNRASEEMRQRVWDWVRSYFVGFEDAPVDIKQAGSYYNKNMCLWGDTIIHRGFTGALEGFW
jgi:hypothetical protein